MRVGVLHRVASRAHDNPRQVFLRETILLEIRGGPQRDGGVGGERHVALVEHIENQVEDILRIRRFRHALGADDEDRSVQAGAHEVVAGLYRGAAGGATGVHADHRLARTEDIVDAPAVRVRHAHEVGGREGEHDGVDIVRGHAGVVQRAGRRNLRLFGEGVRALVGAERGLERAEDGDGLGHCAAPAASKAMTTLPCCA